MYHIRAGLVMNGGWHLNAPDGVEIAADTQDNLRKKYVEYCLQRGFPLLDIQEKITNLICSAPGASNLCQEVKGVLREGVPHFEIFKDEFMNSLMANANKLAEKGEVALTDSGTANRRAEICSNCPKNQSKAICPTCLSTAVRLFAIIRKSQITSADDKLKYCECFRMDCKAFVWLADPGVVANGQQIPDNCWRK